ncbi:hypothetical protein DUI87_07236 [Hirundo rustica rustica]|uniref:Uncharacterized protein n=1 Tax=Hirundo rustica rustica TaxID=333673 RepID=A0A3M0KPR8_HIRRU|nr:hypothetical protein DUI87_07236 [Hirundo rustica rustica]
MGLCESHKVQQDQVPVGQGNPKHKYRLGRETIEISPEEKELKVLIDKPSMCTYSPENQLYPELYQKQCGQQIDGGDSPPPLLPHESPPGVLCPALETLA